jgi:hypothetical protein
METCNQVPLFAFQTDLDRHQSNDAGVLHGEKASVPRSSLPLPRAQLTCASFLSKGFNTRAR